MATHLILQSVIGFLVLLSYVVVLGNVGGNFGLSGSKAGDSYTTSPYWLGLNEATTGMLTYFQIAAAVGYLIIMLYMNGVWGGPSKGLLTYGDKVGHYLLYAFLVSSLCWAFLAHRALESGGKWVWLCAGCLWVAAAAVLLLIGGVFEDDAPWFVTLASLYLGSVVVLADGAGWAARLIHRDLQGRTL